jgi:hypothetical protein
MNAGYRPRVIIMAVCGAGLFVTAGRCGDIRSAPGPTVTIQLVDASTGQPARNAAVRLTSDNGIRCARAPCPTNTKSWKGTSDPQGFLTIPTSYLQDSTQIETESLSSDLIEDTEAANDQVWVAELLPLPSAYEYPPGPPHPLKLIDAATGKAIADAPAAFELRRAGETRPVLDTRTNALGYVFLPDDLPAGALQNTWVIVAGYRTTHVDFAWARHRMPLARQLNRSRVSRQ